MAATTTAFLFPPSPATQDLRLRTPGSASPPTLLATLNRRRHSGWPWLLVLHCMKFCTGLDVVPAPPFAWCGAGMAQASKPTPGGSGIAGMAL
eukprot:CAMPEP_0182859300 /NCGR_PEP_ID=MMETSP0034_2-20130328/4212_1 /TAXON_ID=156128 /ORGANISM="Nephroselmis pyriformis, Strain CCMP717" /LENGTH=92 /DNA_ID=CAMNT_0024990881 /DNA_START=789 /DNA_END=1063 /DNA_ORIENTATION=-